MVHGALTLFQQRRKQVGSILGRARPYPDSIDPTTRPENLSLEQLAELMAIEP